MDTEYEFQWKKRKTDLTPGSERMTSGELATGSDATASAREASVSDSALQRGHRVSSMHVVSTDLPVCAIECKEAWDKLSKQEKHYAHHFCKAAWAGARICAYQLSEEAPAILRILLLVFSGLEPMAKFKERCLAAEITERQWKYFVAYAACFLSNMGNYLAFGDTKFVPGLREENLNMIIKLCPLQGERRQRLLELWESNRRRIYSLSPSERQLGIPPNGCSMYYSKNITREDIKLVQEWMAQQGMEAWNTRLWRQETVKGAKNEEKLPEFELLIASSLKLPTERHQYKDKCIIHIVYGDYQEDLAEAVHHLRDAIAFCSNEHQKAMLLEYIKYFETGSIEAHKQAQRHWLSYKGGLLEENIGFIETYRDPMGIRAEFEGFLAVVNKEKSSRFAALVDASEQLLLTLPWPKEFEKDVFHKPEFTSIDVLAFANSSIPVGINVPNYEDVRQNYGFKNVSLGNVLDANEVVEKISFLSEDDQALFRDLKGEAFDIQISCHELLGHGSGKLFMRGKDGTYNYDYGKVMHPFTKEAVATCYTPGQTWDSVFGELSSTLEECRAECVGIYLSANPLVSVVYAGDVEVLEIFGHSGDQAENVMYINWLLMVRAGLLALEFFSPDTCQWHQAHMQARFVILRVLLAASMPEMEQGSTSAPSQELQTKPLVQIQSIGSDDILVSLERNKIQTVGVPAISQFLRRLQVYRSTADLPSAKALFDELTKVPATLLTLRRVVLSKKKPRPMFVQMNTSIDDRSPSGVQMEEYPATHEGLIMSYVARFQEWIHTC